MTEVTLDPADTAAASGPSAPPGTSRAVGARIDAIGVGQHAGERQILHEVSLSVEPGELIALAGGSGAGKTTLLEILAGLRAPSVGQVRHDGVRIDARGTRGSGVGYVPQDDISAVDITREVGKHAPRQEDCAVVWPPARNEPGQSLVGRGEVPAEQRGASQPRPQARRLIEARRRQRLAVGRHRGVVTDRQRIRP